MHITLEKNELVIRIPVRRLEQATLQKAKLTLRELQTYDLMCEGKVAKEIASKLGITTRTAKCHIGRVYKRLGVGNRLEFVQAGYRA